MNIKVNFLGAAQNVTGSRHLLEAGGYKILVDCGLYQERKLLERNWESFAVLPASINAVLLTHAHLDHCGWLPKLVKDGFRGKIYCTGATFKIARLVLLDSANVMEEDAEFKRRRHQQEGRKGPYPEAALYTVADAEACLPFFSTVKYGETLKIANGIEAVFYNAGHILGSSMIKLTVKGNGSARTILFSGDVGRADTPILADPAVFEQADYVVVESTYGDNNHSDRKAVKEMLAEIINSTNRAGGNIVIPSFAIERSQDVLYYLNELLLEDKIPHLMVFLDSPMALKVNEIFKQHPELFDVAMAGFMARRESPFDFAGFNPVRTVEQSKAINHIKGTVLVIAGSGMCTGGRIKHHLVNNISRPESTILFVGYQAEGTLGREIIDGSRRVRIFGQSRPVLARIARINGFSAHADRDELVGWLKNLKKAPKKVFVVHGEPQTAQNFRDFLAAKTGWNVLAPAYKNQIILD